MSLLLLLSGCTAMVPPSDGEDSALRFERVVVPNVEADPGEDYLPLSLGTYWLYRDATGGDVPIHPAAQPIWVGVVAKVASGDATELYVVRKTVVGQPDETLYLHRTTDGLYAYGRAQGGQVDVFPSPVLLLPLPFERGKEWTYSLGGEVFRAQVRDQEMVAMVSGIFPGSWHLDVEKTSTGALEGRWYARSVGLVRFVGGSLVYELERSALLPGGPDVLALDWADRGTARKSRAGDVVLVGLPAKQGSGYAWTRIDSSDEFLRGSSQAGEFFPDLPSTSETGSDGTVLGTFVYQAEATQATPPGVPALLEFAYVPIGGGAAAYSFSVRIGVDP